MANMHCADQGNGTYLNPIIFGGYGDHTILKDGRDYFMTFGGGGSERGALMYHSRDLVNWEPLYYMFENFPIGMWAPDLVKVGDTYYYYDFAATERPHWNHGDVYVSWTKDIWKGGWSEPSIVRANIPSIDPGHVVGEDGKRYLFMSQNMMFPLTDDGLKAAGPYKIVYPDWPIPDDFDIEGQCTESPKLVWHNGWLYLTTAQGGTGGPSTAHMVTSLRSRSVFGPWELNPYNPIKHTYSDDETWQRKGHGTLIEGPDGEHWYLLYGGYPKGYRDTVNKATLLEPVEWTEDGWWRVCPESKDDEPIPMPAGGAKVDGCNYSLDTDFRDGLPLFFEPAKLNTTAERLSFGERGMTITGAGTDAANSGVILQKREYKDFEVIVELTADWHACAGVCIGNAGHVYGIAVEQDRIEIQQTNTGHWLVREHWVKNGNADWSGNHIFLKVRTIKNIATSWYSQDGENWKKLNICWDLTLGSGWHRWPGVFCAKDGEATFHSYKIVSLD